MHFSNAQDMGMDYWKFVGVPMYSSNEVVVNFEDHGKATFDKIYHDWVQSYSLTIEDDIRLHMEISTTNVEQPGLPSLRVDLNYQSVEA